MDHLGGYQAGGRVRVLGICAGGVGKDADAMTMLNVKGVQCSLSEVYLQALGAWIWA